jgi:hypothetical protein
MEETGIIVEGIELKKLYYRIEEVESLFPLARTKIYELIRTNIFIAYCPNGRGKKPVFISRTDLIKYFQRIKIPAEKWAE